MLKKKYADEGLDWKKVHAKIKDVIIKSLISVEPHIVNGTN
jgi:hypothetical protein